MKWIFPNNNGGRESGFHDAGVETFKGNFDRYLARELIQNSLDARHDANKPVNVEFHLLELDRRKIPGMDYLQETFNRCAEYWTDDPKASSFFKRASELAARSRLTALKVSDYNTTGVRGSDTDRNGNWYHLIRSAGSSSKGSGEGGSFGIGKNAPFAASSLRTVFYSTVAIDNTYAFQGVSMLVSHKLSDGAIAQPTGFLGGDGGASIRESGHIPSIFRRKESGLDITILEYPASPNWQDDLVYSVLDNFWPAIEAVWEIAFG